MKTQNHEKKMLTLGATSILPGVRKELGLNFTEAHKSLYFPVNNEEEQIKEIKDFYDFYQSHLNEIESNKNVLKGLEFYYE